MEKLQDWRGNSDRCMMNRLSLSLFLLFFIVIAPFKFSSSQGFREPASVVKDCFQRMAQLLAAKDPQSSFSLWRRFLSLPQKEFDYDYYQSNLRDLAQLEGDHFIPLGEGPEEVLAFIVASQRRLGLEESFEPKGWGQWRRGYFEKIIGRLKKRGRLNISDIDDLTRELFVGAYGPSLKWKKFFSGQYSDNQMMKRVVHEDLVKKGLLRVFKEYRLPANHLQKFSKTPWSKALMTSLFNLPMLAGLPPLYLPALKKVTISEALAREILENGLNENAMAKVELELGASFGVKERYEKLRKAYLAGVMVYLTIAGIYDTYQLTKELDEESAQIEESLDAGSQITEGLEVLEKENIDVFSEDSYTEGATFCEAIAECLAEVGDKEMCVSLMDPDSRCKHE